MRLRCPVEIAKGGARFYKRTLLGRVHADISHAAKINRDAIVAQGISGNIMAGSADGQLQSVLMRERDRGRNVIGSGTPYKHSRALFNHGVPNPASLIIVAVTGQNHAALQFALQILNFCTGYLLHRIVLRESNFIDLTK